MIMKQTRSAILAGTLLASLAINPGVPWLPLGSAAFAQGATQGPVPAGALVLENLAFKGTYGAVTVPRVVLEGSTATRADIEGLFDPARTADIGTRVARISARSISIPMIEVRQETPDGPVVTAYRDTVFRNVQNGVIGDGVTPLMTVKGKASSAGKGAKALDFEMTARAMVLKGFDLGLMLRAFFEKGQPDEPMKVAAVEQSIGQITLNVGQDLKMTIAGASIRDFMMRATEKPLITAMNEAHENEKAKAPDWEKKNLALLMPMVTMMGIGTMELTGLTADFVDPVTTSRGTFGLDRMTAASRSFIPEKLAIQGLRVNADGTSVRIGEMAFDGLDLAPTFAAFKADGGTVASDADIAAALPRLKLARLAGVDIDAADPKVKGERIKAKLGLFELVMGNHVGPIPGDVSLNLDRFQMNIPARTTDKGLKDILALGYSALDVSARYAQVWDEARKTLRLTDLSVRAADMFALSAKAELQNVSRDLFSLDKAKMAVAALAVSARSLDVSLTNNSLFERVIAQQAKDLRRKPEDIRAELAAGATLIVPMMLGDHPAARTLGPILGRFVAEPKNLKVTLTAKDPAGLGATDFIGTANPMDLLRKVDITATANE
jgi:hypothetical protein